MHEGASGGGKSEMLQDIAREPDGEVLLSTNTVTGEKTYLHISSTWQDRAGVRRYGYLLSGRAEQLRQAGTR